MTLLDKDEKDDFFMLMRTNDAESFESKYDKIMSQTFRRKSRRKMMGSKESSGKTLAPLRPTRSNYSAKQNEHTKRMLKRAITMHNVVSAWHASNQLDALFHPRF
jgi:FtsZ-interacting cell division protein YlmF